MTVHSTQLGRVSASDTSGHLLYTVPSGKRTILKSVTFQNGYTSGTNRIYLALDLGGVEIYLTAVVPTEGSAGDTAYLLPWVVLNAGDTVTVKGAQEPYTCVVSGAELTL